MPTFVQFVLFASPVFMAAAAMAFFLNRKATEFKVDQIIREKRDEERAAKKLASKQAKMADIVADEEFEDSTPAAKPASNVVALKKTSYQDKGKEPAQHNAANAAAYAPPSEPYFGDDIDAEMEAFIAAGAR